MRSFDSESFLGPILENLFFLTDVGKILIYSIEIVVLEILWVTLTKIFFKR